MLDRPALGVVMDPIHTLLPEKDSTIAVLTEAEQRGFELFYLEFPHLYLQYGIAWAHCQSLRISNQTQQNTNWYSLSKPTERPLDQFDVILIRKNPPFDPLYLYATQILEHAESNGTLIINKPQSLRDANEKLFATWFPQCMPPTLVSANKTALISFMEEQECVILKPLNGMGGERIFKCTVDDPNRNVLIELLTDQGTQYMMAQRFIPEISEGDKRIMLIDGEPNPHAHSRTPTAPDFRGNLAAGGQTISQDLTERDRWICAQIGPTLREKGLTLVGIDVIGDYLTEINVTSPGWKTDDQIANNHITEHVVDCIIDKLNE